MIEYIALIALLVSLTAAGYFIAKAGTKETSYEEAKGTQKPKVKAVKEKAPKKLMIKLGKRQKEPEKVSLASNIVKEALSNYKKPQPSKSQSKDHISNGKPEIEVKPILKPAAVVKPAAIVKPNSVKPSVVVKPSAIVKPAAIVKPSPAAKPSAEFSKEKVLDGAEPAKSQKVKKQVGNNPSSIKKQQENAKHQVEKKQPNNQKPEIVKKQPVVQVPNNTDKVDASKTDSNKKLQLIGKPKKEEVLKAVEKAIVEKAALEKLESTPKNSHDVKSSENKKSASTIAKANIVQTPEIPLGEAEQLMIVAKQMQEAKQMANLRKKKPKQKSVVVAQVETNSLSKILPLMEGARLKSAEIQIMIDLLLNRQNECNTKGGEWVEMGRIDPLTQLRKQLDDAEKRLKDTTDSRSALSDKITDLRGELKNEKITSTNLKKQLEQTTVFMQQKLQESSQANSDQLNLKMKDLNTSLERSFQAQSIQLKQKLQAEYEAQLKHINAIHDETEQQLQQYCHNLAGLELQLQNSRATKAEYEQRMQSVEAAYAEIEKQCKLAVQSREELAQTCQQYQQHIASLTEQTSQTEAAMSRQLHDLQSGLKASDNARNQALSQFSQVTGEREQLMQQIANLENIRELFTQNQSKLKNTISEKVDLESRFNKVDNELSSVREIAKNQMLKIEELQKEKEELASQAFRPAADGQENGDSHEKENIAKNNLNTMYEENICSLSNEITKLNETLEKQQNKCKDTVNSYEEDWKNMRDTLGMILPAILQVAVDDKPALVKKVEEETKKVIDKKPEVVEKVVKIPEENSEKYKKLQVLNEDLAKKVKELETEKNSLNVKLADIAAAPKPVDNSSQLTDLTDQNKALNEKVTSYMSVLANTESLLESLQISVEREEKSWKEKMAEKDAEVKQLLSEKSTLLVKLDEIKSTVPSKPDDSSEISCLKARLQKEQEQNQKLSSQLESQSQKSTNPEVLNANGSQNGIESHEGKLSPEDSTSLLSNSSASEVLGSTAVSASKNDTKKKKKRK